MNFTPYFAKLSFIGIVAISILTGCQPDSDDPDDDLPPPNTSTFCYSVTTSTSDYDTIVGGTIISETNADDVFAINLDFPFTFCGETFDNLYIGWTYTASFTYENQNGFLNFFDYEIRPIGGAMVEENWGTLPGGDVGYISKLKFQTTGDPGNRISTLEYRDFEFINYSQSGTEEYEYTVSYQIKLYENGNKISYHYGPHEMDINFTEDAFVNFTVGMYSTTDVDALFLSGDPANPTSNTTHLNGELTHWPAVNTMYLFE